MTFLSSYVPYVLNESLIIHHDISDTDFLNTYIALYNPCRGINKKGVSS